MVAAIENALPARLRTSDDPVVYAPVYDRDIEDPVIVAYQGRMVDDAGKPVSGLALGRRLRPARLSANA